MTAKLTYREQLLHPSWQRKRLEIMERDDFTCQHCCDGESTLNVHHKCYVKGRLAWEYPGHQLITLCATCHAFAHDRLARLASLWATLPSDGPFSDFEAMAMLSGWETRRCTWPDMESAQVSHQVSEDAQDCSPRMFAVGEVAAFLSQLDIDTKTLIAFRDALVGTRLSDKEALAQMTRALTESQEVST